MKYVSGRIKELKVGISSYSEDKTPFSVVGNMDVIGIISATTVSISTTTDVASEFTNINVSGISTFNGEIDSNGRIVGAATSNVIPFLYSNYSDLPSAGTYHGAFAHVHATQRAYFAHGGAWYQLINQEANGTVGTGTEKYDIGITSVTNLRVAGISTYDGNLDVQSSVLITGITTIGGLVDINAGAQANTLKVEDLTDNRVVIAGTGGELEDDANLTFNGTTFNVGSAITMYQATGIVSATSFFGDGSGLENTGSTLSEPSSGTQRLVTTSLTTGTMTSSGIGSELAFDYSNNHLEFTDNTKATFGTGNDLQLYHNATASYIDNNTGALYLRNNVDDDDGGNIIIEAKSGKASAVFQDDEGVRLYYDDAEKIRTTNEGVLVSGGTTTGTLSVTGISTFNDDVSFVGASGTIFFDKSDNALEFSDDTQLRFGTSPTEALKIYHNSSDNDTYITNGTTGSNLYVRAWASNKELYLQAKGNTEIWSGTTEKAIVARQGGRVELYYSNAKKLQTQDYGIEIIDGLTVSGVSTFTNTVDVNGHTELNTLQVAGISTFNEDVTIGDVIGSKRLYIGNPNAQIYRQNDHLYIDVAGEKNFYVTTNSAGGNAGAIYLRPKGTEQGVTILPNGSVELYHDNSKKLDTIGTGVTVTGDLYATTFRGNGSGLTNLSIPGISTSTTSEFTNLNVTGTTTLATAKVSDLTDNRIVIAGTAGELEDTSKLTFDGTTLAIVGNATFTGNVSVAGTLTSEDKTNIDSIGIVTARTGVRISSGGLVVSSGVATFTDAITANGNIFANFNIIGDGSTNIHSIANVSANTLNGTLQTAAQPNVTSLGTITNLVASSAKVSDLTSGRVVYVGTAGELQDISTFTFNGSTVTAPAFSGDGSALTGITAGGVGAIGGLTVKDEGVVVGTAGSISTLDFLGGTVSVIANTGAAGIATVTLITEQQQNIQTLNVTGVSTFGGAVDINAGLDVDGQTELDHLNVAGVTTFNSPNNFIGNIVAYNPIYAQNDIYANGHIIGDGATNISGMNNVTATNFNSTSDAKLKTNVQTITSPLEKLNQIDGVSFDWVADLNPYEDESSSMGVIADTVEKVLPVLVAEHTTGYKTVNYNGLIGLLIEAVKEQQVQITELKSKLDSLS